MRAYPFASDSSMKVSACAIEFIDYILSLLSVCMYGRLSVCLSVCQLADTSI